MIRITIISAVLTTALVGGLVTGYTAEPASLASEEPEPVVASSEANAEATVEETTEAKPVAETKELEEVPAPRPAPATIKPMGPPPASCKTEECLAIYGATQEAFNSELESLPADPADPVSGHAAQSKAANNGQGEGANMCGIKPDATLYGKPC